MRLDLETPWCFMFYGFICPEYLVNLTFEEKVEEKELKQILVPSGSFIGLDGFTLMSAVAQVKPGIPPFAGPRWAHSSHGNVCEF